MVYIFAALSVLLTVLLTITYKKYKSLQALTLTTTAQYQQQAELNKEHHLRAEAQVHDLSVRIQDLQKTIVDQRAHTNTLEKKAEVEIAQALKRGEAYGRADARKRSTFVAHGFASENFAPLLDDHDWNLKDFRHMGDPIDYLVIPGMNTVHAKGAKADIDEVILLDIKTGKSNLNTVQRRIRDAVVDGRVRFCIYNTDTKELRKWPPDPELKQLEIPFP